MMDANEFRKAAEAGEIPIDSHDQVLRIAYIYTDEGAWWENGVFDVVDKLRARGWPFGQGNFKFNRTLDTFYVAQIMAGHYNSSDQLNNEILTTNMFDSFYSQQRELIDQDAWKQYYSPSFLVQAASARFYRLPNLRDLPDASDPLANPRDRGTGHFTKLYHWAYAVARTRAVEPTLPAVTIDHLALSTLRRTASRLRDEEWVDVWEWEAYYSKERWNSSVHELLFLEPDRDGTREPEFFWCGRPDGGVITETWWRGWEPELGSEEEMEFMAAVAVEETKGLGETGELDCTIQSHMLLGVFRVAYHEAEEKERRVEELRRLIVEAGRLDGERAEPWIRQALLVMEPYVRKAGGCPAAEEERRDLFRQVLVENGQLFGWVPRSSKEFSFKLKRKQE
ncbi:hypothetical protein RB599_010304 [Gaeumannomyces hyphopodioides]